MAITIQPSLPPTGLATGDHSAEVRPAPAEVGEAGLADWLAQNGLALASPGEEGPHFAQANTDGSEPGASASPPDSLGKSVSTAADSISTGAASDSAGVAVNLTPDLQTLLTTPPAELAANMPEKFLDAALRIGRAKWEELNPCDSGQRDRGAARDEVISACKDLGLSPGSKDVGYLQSIFTSIIGPLHRSLAALDQKNAAPLSNSPDAEVLERNSNGRSTTDRRTTEAELNELRHADKRVALRVQMEIVCGDLARKGRSENVQGSSEQAALAKDHFDQIEDALKNEKRSLAKPLRKGEISFKQEPRGGKEEEWAIVRTLKDVCEALKKRAGH